jgi:hypothetical protein
MTTRDSALALQRYVGDELDRQIERGARRAGRCAHIEKHE